jgi:hypothetical protein
MERPNIKQLDEIEALLKDIEETESSLQALRERLNVVARGLGSVISDKDKLVELATYLYWMVPEVKPAPLAEAITGQSKIHLLKKHIPAVNAGIHCDRCNKAIPFSSRNKLHETIRNPKARRKRQANWPEGYLIVCKTCQEEILAGRNVKYRQEEFARQKRLKELRQMLCEKYLKTPEWQERRRRHLKSAGYRCQVCNAENTRLDVHH